MVNAAFQSQFEIAVADQQAEFGVRIKVSRIWVQRGPAVVWTTTTNLHVAEYFYLALLLQNVVANKYTMENQP